MQDLHTGTIWLLFCRNRMDGDEPEISAGTAPRTVWVTSSDDDGATWSEPREITGAVKLPQWSWYATGPGHGIQLRRGRLVIACDHRVMEFGDGTRDPDYSHVIYSDDQGASWHIGGSSDRGANESTAVENRGRLALPEQPQPVATQPQRRQFLPADLLEQRQRREGVLGGVRAQGV